MGLHACQYCTCMHIQSHTQHCMNDEADNSRFVSMHVNMHLAFKELKCILIIPALHHSTCKEQKPLDCTPFI